MPDEEVLVTLKATVKYLLDQSCPRGLLKVKVVLVRLLVLLSESVCEPPFAVQTFKETELSVRDDAVAPTTTSTFEMFLVDTAVVDVMVLSTPVIDFPPNLQGFISVLATTSHVIPS